MGLASLMSFRRTRVICSLDTTFELNGVFTVSGDRPKTSVCARSVSRFDAPLNTIRSGRLSMQDNGLNGACAYAYVRGQDPDCAVFFQ